MTEPIDSTAPLEQPVQPEWGYFHQSQPEPEQPREPGRHRLLRVGLGLLTTMALVVLALGVTALVQYQRAQDAEAHLATTQHTLAVTQQNLSDTKESLASTHTDLVSAQSDLSDTKANLADVKGSLSDAQDQIAVCALVTKTGTLSYDAVMSTSKALSQSLQFDYGTGNLDKASKDIDGIGKVLDDNGYTYIDDLWEACTPTGSST